MPSIVVTPWPEAAASAVALAVEPWNLERSASAAFYLVRYAFAARDGEIPALIVVTGMDDRECSEMLAGVRGRLASVLAADQGVVISTFEPSSRVGQYLAKEAAACRISSVEEVTA